MESQTRRTEYRSAYRSAYRPARASYRRAQPVEKEEGKSLKEILLMQCVVCGVILAATLIMCLLDIPAVDDFRKDVKAALSENMKPEDFSQKFTAVSGYIKHLTGTVPGAVTQEEGGEGQEEGSPQGTPAATETEPAIGIENPAGSFRIDEEILQEINERNRQEEEMKKKQIVPPEEQI